LAIALRALPTCNDPVGLGAKRTLFTWARLAPRRGSRACGLRDIGYGEVAGNFAIASVGNIIGGVLLVTLSRFSQARAASRYVGALGD
jgi:hypothetical protein